MEAEKEGLISIVIVNWNTRDLLLGCLESIYENIKGVDFEVVVVDNASSDGSAEAAGSHFPQATLIPSRENLGFARGNNLALREARGEWVMLLNPDTVISPGSVEKMLEFMREHPEVGIVGPMLSGRDGRAQVSSFGLFPSPVEAMFRAVRIWKWAPKSKAAKKFMPQPNAEGSWVYVEHLLGACMFMRREVIEQIGGFDEGFFLFLEETDLCFRARREGWKLAYFTGADIIHLGEQSMQNILHRTGGLYIRSYNRYCRKHGMGLCARATVNAFLVLTVFTETLARLIKHRSPGRAYQTLGALWYGYMRNPSPGGGGDG